MNELNQINTYKVYTGHWNYEDDCMDDEIIHYVPETTFDRVWNFCEREADKGFDVICEFEHNGQWLHAFAF